MLKKVKKQIAVSFYAFYCFLQKNTFYNKQEIAMFKKVKKQITEFFFFQKLEKPKTHSIESILYIRVVFPLLLGISVSPQLPPLNCPAVQKGKMCADEEDGRGRFTVHVSNQRQRKMLPSNCLAAVKERTHVVDFELIAGDAFTV